jgi:hypothetical protein
MAASGKRRLRRFSQRGGPCGFSKDGQGADHFFAPGPKARQRQPHAKEGSQANPGRESIERGTHSGRLPAPGRNERRQEARSAPGTSQAPPLTVQAPPRSWHCLLFRRPDGTEGNPSPVVFNLTQKGKVLTGTAGPADKQWTVEKGAVNAGKATFEVQQPDGPLFKFTLTIDKGRLQGDMAGTRDGVVRGHAKVDAAKAK